MLELAIVLGAFVGSIYFLTEKGDSKYSTEYDEDSKAVHRVPLSRVTFLHSGKVVKPKVKVVRKRRA